MPFNTPSGSGKQKFQVSQVPKDSSQEIKRKKEITRMKLLKVNALECQNQQKVTITEIFQYNLERYVCTDYEGINLFIDLDTKNYRIIYSEKGRFLVRNIPYGASSKRPVLNIDTGELFTVGKESSCGIEFVRSLDSHNNHRYIKPEILDEVKQYKKMKILGGKRGSDYVNKKIGSHF